MDRWVRTLNMKKTVDLVDLRELEKKKKKKERLKNDEKVSEDEEHEGMDENAIAAHEEATKVKTVLEIGTDQFTLFVLLSRNQRNSFLTWMCHLAFGNRNRGGDATVYQKGPFC